MKHLKKNTIKFISIIMLVLITVLAVFMVPQKAAQVNRCKINVVDNGSTQEERNEDISIIQKIISNKDKELTFQVDLENYQYQTTQIALVIDNSYSMWSEDKYTNSKDSIINLVNNIFNNIENVQMSLSTYDGNKVAMGTNKEEIISQINNINNYQGITSKTGLKLAKETFTNENVGKYIILFTDGQEKISDEILQIKEDKIGLLTAFYGNDKAISNQYKLAGTVYNIKDVTQENLNNTITAIEAKIKSKLIKEVQNINIENIFSNEIAQNFTFELIGTPSIGTITKTDLGYTWNITKLNKKDKATFKYKLTLKNDLDRNIMYKDINTNNKMSINYQDSESQENVVLENNNTPKINIIETYTLKIKAINKKYIGINAKNIEFKIEQIDVLGNIVRTEIQRTNNNGEIILDDITQNGAYTYRITQISTPVEYELSDESKRVKSLEISKDYISNNFTATTNDADNIFEISNDAYEKVVTATIRLDPKEVILNINKIDEEYKNSLANVDFSLIEPTVESIPSGTAINVRTDEKGKAVLTGEIAGQGTYTYILKEVNAPTGYYENKEDMALNITFNENGRPTAITSNSENILIDRENAIKEDVINIDVTNKMLDYKLKVQAFNEKYKDIKIDNVKVSIIGRDDSGKEVYNKEETTKNGKIELPINKYGQITYTIKQISAPAEYNITEDVTYTITRDFENNNLILNSGADNEDIILDNDKKELTVNIYLEQRTFNLKLNKIDKDETQVKLDGAKIKLIQPARRDALEETTQNGELNFEADVVCLVDNEDGTYTTKYSLSEIEKPIGYQKISRSIGINITFNSNGEVINAVSENEEYVEVIKRNLEVEVNLKNEKQTYSMQILTKHKNYKDIVIPNVSLDITGNTENGTFLNKTSLTTDESGNSQVIENLRQDGKLEFQIQENAVPTGYVLNNETAYASYNYRAETLSTVGGNSENIKVEVDNENLLITITVYIEPKTFDIDISKTSSILEGRLIEGATFRLVQPDIGTQKREVIIEDTKQDEILKMSAEVAGIGGPYEYILKEVEVPEGYENSKIQVKFNITFDSNGNISKLTTEESNNTKNNYIKDESSDYIASAEPKNYVTIGDFINSNNNDVIPLTIENEAEKTNLEISVVNKNYTQIVVKDVDVTIVGKTSSGEFYRNTLKTNENGKINIARIDNVGDFDFSAIAIKTPIGYLPQSEETIAYLNKDATTTELSEKINSANVSVQGNKILIKIYLEPKTFDIEISKYEQALGDLLIPNARFSLTQPDITEGIPRSLNKDTFKRRTVTGTTKKSEKLIIKGEVAGQGTYEYTLKEKAPSGYEDKQIEYTLKITFDEDGNIQNIQKADDENTTNSSSHVSLGEYTINKIPLTIMNYQKTYSITVEITNTKYRDREYYVNNILHFIKGIKIENAKVKVIGTANNSVVYESDILTTDSNGLVTFEPLTQRGDVTYTIKLLEVPTGYIIPEDKVIGINKDEITTEITKTNNATNVTIDNTEKSIHVDMFLDVQTFELEINKKDKDENDVLVAGATFTVEQPDFSDVGRTDRKRNEITGSTKLNTPLSLTAEVGGPNSPYTYKITEDTVPSGYTVDNKTTQIEVTFNKDGTVKDVNCLNDNEQAYIDNTRTNGSKVAVNIVNTKKPYTINVIASNKRHESIKVEGLNLKIIGKDKSNKIIYESENLVTNSSGQVSVLNLKTTGDITYEIVQLEKAPAAYILGDKKLVNLNINKQNNVITCLNSDDEDIQINNSSKTITVKLFLEPKTFMINISKLDYDDKLNNIDTLIQGATFQLTDPRGVSTEGRTQKDSILNMEAEVAGEGTYTYELWETWPQGYQEFYAKILLTITFDENGQIIEKSEETESVKPVVMESEWWTWRRDDEENLIRYKTENKKGMIELTGNTEDSVDLFVTNVKKEYSIVINAKDDKYGNLVDDVCMQIIATDENGTQLFNKIEKTQSGKITIPELRYIGKMHVVIKQVSVPKQYNNFEDKNLVFTKEFPSINAIIDIDNTSPDIDAQVKTTSSTKAPINSPTTIIATIMLDRKTFDINLEKVDIDNNQILLPGAKFVLTQYDEKNTQTEVTNEDGRLVLSADIDGIEQDDVEDQKEYLYKLEEQTAPNGYNKITTIVQIYVTLNKQDEITNVRITNGSSFITEKQENRTNKNIDLLAQNAKGGKLYNLEFTKKYVNKPVEGSRYQIKINAETGENLNIKEFTDEKGQINVSKIPGSQKIIITFKELQPAQGYELDEKERIVTVQRSSLTGDIEVIEEETSNDVIATYDKSTNTICVEINKQITNQENLIKIISVDKNDETKKVAYATVQLTFPETGEIIEKTTNSSGYINLDDIEAPGEGDYTYILKVTKTPKGYLDFQGEDIYVNITFDEDGYIKDTYLTIPNEYADGYYSTEQTENKLQNIANIIEKNTPREVINLNILKKGENDSNLKDVEFDIVSATTINGEETISTITKKTNQNGDIYCEILSGDKVEITLKETKTLEAYKLDSTPRNIVLEKVGDNLRVVESQTDNTIKYELIDKNLNVILTNKYKPAKVIMQLINEDESGEAIKLRGINVKLKELSSKKEFNVTTDEAGEIDFNDLPVQEEGTYYFVITNMTTTQGFEIPTISTQTPIRINVKYTRTQEGDLQVNAPITYSSPEDIVKGVSYTNYSAPEEYRLFLRVVLSEEVSRDAKYNVNIYKLDKEQKDQGKEEYLQGANFNLEIDYFNNTVLNFNDTTNEEGKITQVIPFVTGNIKINLQERTAPEGYKIDDKELKQIILNKNSEGIVSIETDIDSQSMYTTFDNEELNIFVMDTPDNSETPDVPDNPEDREYEFTLEIDKIEKQTKEEIEGVEFKVVQINEQTEEEQGEETVVTTNEEGKAQIKVDKAKAKGEYVYKIKESTPEGYKDIEEIKIKVYIGENGKVEKIELLEENNAVTETKVEDEIAKVTIENEKEPTNPDNPDNKEYEFIILLEKIERLTGRAMENVQFTITPVNEQEEQEAVVTTNKEGKIALKITGVKAKGEYIYKIKENTPKGYKDIEEIQIKVYVGEDGELEKIELLKENEAVKEIKVKDGIIEITVENEKETESPENPPENPDNPPDKPDTPPDTPDNPDVPDTPEEPTNPNNPDAPESPKQETPNGGNKTIKAAIKNAVSKIPYTGASYIVMLLLLTGSVASAISYIKYKNTK